MGAARHGAPPRSGRRSLVLNAVATLLVITGGVAAASAVMARPAPPPAPAATLVAPGAVAERAPGLSEPRSVAPRPTRAATRPVQRVVKPVAKPSRLSIPSLGLDEALTTVGLREDGTLEVPEGDAYDSPAWLRTGPRPGQIGPAVIEGHVDSYRGPSVFYGLGAMKPGQQVTVTTEDGAKVSFEVYDVKSYRKDDFPSAAVYGIAPVPELRLITCGGEFDTRAKTYLSNTVVFARAV